MRGGCHVVRGIALAYQAFPFNGLPAKRNPTRDDFTPLILIPNTDYNSKVFPKAWPDFAEIATESTHGFIIKSNSSHG